MTEHYPDTEPQLPPDEAYDERYMARIAEFQSTLPKVAIASLPQEIDLSATSPAEEAARQFTAEHSLHIPALYVVPEIATDMCNSLVGFEPLVSNSNKTSRNGVFFGIFHFDDGSEVRVAVKPHESFEDDITSRREAEKTCLKDYFTNVAAQEAKFDSLIPFGFLLDEDGSQYSLTVLDEDLKSFDGMEWSKFYTEGFETSGMETLWSKTASQVALLHSTGNSFHGDLYPRNVATDSDGHIILHDWEFGNLTTEAPNDIEDRFGKSWLDIKSLMIGMARPSYLPQNQNPGIGLFENCDGSWWEGFKEIFLDDYLDWRRTFAAQGKHHTQVVRETEEELVQLEHALHMQIDQMQQTLALQTVT